MSMSRTAAAVRPSPTSTSRGRRGWVGDVVQLGAVAVLGAGLAVILLHRVAAGLILGVGMASVVGVAVAGIVQNRRTELLEHVERALHPLVGQDARMKPKRWSGLTKSARPRRLVIQYSPLAKDTDPTWKPAICETLAARVGVAYEVVDHSPRRCRLTLGIAIAETEEENSARQEAFTRAQDTVRELLGPSRIRPAWDGDELSALDVEHEAGVKVASTQKRAHTERVLSTMLPGRWRARWDLEGSTVRFELRPTLPTVVPHPSPRVEGKQRYRIPLAVDEDGQVVCWDLKSTAPHKMTAGKTGTGKTVEILGVVTEWCSRGWPAWIVDPKRIEFMGMRGWPNVQIVATGVAEQVATIYHAWQRMEERYAKIENGEADEDDFEPLLVVLDEYRDFNSAVNAWWTSIKVRGMPSKCPVFEWVGSLARKGRSARIHVLLGTQRPDAEFLGGEMRDNFAARVSLGRLSPQGAMMMWEAAYIGVAVPRIPGRGTALNEDERPVEVQSYWTPDPRRALKKRKAADLEILERLLPAAAEHQPLRVQMDEPDDLDGEKAADTSEWALLLESTLVHDPMITPIDLSAAPAQGPLEEEPDPESVPDRHLSLLPDPPAEDDWEGYSESRTVKADDVTPGDLLLVDENLDQWGVVAEALADITEDGLVCIDWRGDGDEYESWSLESEAMLTVRRPLEDEVVR